MWLLCAQGTVEPLKVGRVMRAGDYWTNGRCKLFGGMLLGDGSMSKSSLVSPKKRIAELNKLIVKWYVLRKSYPVLWSFPDTVLYRLRLELAELAQLIGKKYKK